jgi:hypothetical protein
MRNRMDSDIPEGTTIVILDTSGGIYDAKPPRCLKLTHAQMFC